MITEKLKLQIELSRIRQPFYIALIGSTVGLIALLCAILNNKLTDSRFNAVLLFANTAISTAIAGASGIAQQSNSNQSEIKNIENVDIEK